MNLLMKRLLSKLKKVLFTEREIICISDHDIKSKKIGVVFLVWNVLLVYWVAFTTVKYFDLREKIVSRENEIIKLNIDKQKLLSNIVILESDIAGIKNFIISLNRYDRFTSIDNRDLYDNINNNFNYNYKSNYDLVLNRAKDSLNKINLALLDRINGLENIEKRLDIKHNNIQQVSFYKNIDNTNNVDLYEDVNESIVLKNNLDDNILYLKNLEEFINAVPFSEPINSGYVSSNFGKRLDPFLKTPRSHHGVDLVGSYMAKVYATSDGDVIFVGNKGGYGNVVILQHKYNIKTVYAHLNNFNVKVGDRVKRGDVIGIQGNTGRSTGQHLHYEIIVDHQRYNPLEFIKVGSEFY